MKVIIAGSRNFNDYPSLKKKMDHFRKEHEVTEIVSGAAPGADAEGKPSSYMAEIQKFAGKLGQELRDQHEKLQSDDIKYVLNMIISAVDLDKLTPEDIEFLEKVRQKFVTKK